jgi:hypothetical protein
MNIRKYVLIYVISDTYKYRGEEGLVSVRGATTPEGP